MILQTCIKSFDLIEGNGIKDLKTLDQKKLQGIQVMKI